METTSSKWITLNEILNRDYFLHLDGFYNQVFEKYAMEDFHKHARIEIMFAEEGECSILFLNDNGDLKSVEEIQLSSNMGIIVDANVWHKLVVKDRCKIINHEYLLKSNSDEVNCLGKLIKNIKDAELFIRKFHTYALFYGNNKIIWLLKNIIDETKNITVDKNNLRTIDIYSYLMLIEISSQVNSNNKFLSCEVYVKKAIKYINNHLKEKIKSEDIANYAAVNYAYLENKFKKSTGLTLGDYIAKQKCYLAESLLKNTSTPVASISEQLGFGTRQQFNNVFKKFVGTSPNEYRLKNQSNVEEIRMGFTGSYGIEFIYPNKKNNK